MTKKVAPGVATCRQAAAGGSLDCCSCTKPWPGPALPGTHVSADSSGTAEKARRAAGSRSQAALPPQTAAAAAVEVRASAAAPPRPLAAAGSRAACCAAARDRARSMMRAGAGAANKVDRSMCTAAWRSGPQSDPHPPFAMCCASAHHSTSYVSLLTALGFAAAFAGASALLGPPGSEGARPRAWWPLGSSAAAAGSNQASNWCCMITRCRLLRPPCTRPAAAPLPCCPRRAAGVTTSVWYIGGRHLLTAAALRPAQPPRRRPLLPAP